jgi:LssY C-terminus
MRTTVACVVAASLLAGGCATFDPKPQSEWPFLQRAVTRADGEVKVSVAALTPQESREALGIDLADAGIQPVWVKVENAERVRYYIPPIVMDDRYFSPLEAAWKGHGWFSEDTNQRIDRHFREQRLPAYVDPGQSVSGFVFTHLDRGVKSVSVELIAVGAEQLRRFQFLADVPGMDEHYKHVDFEKLYAPGEMRDLDPAQLRAWLEQQPCCTLGGDRRTPADPLNIALIGKRSWLFSALARRGWNVTEVVDAESAWHTIESSVFGTHYRYSPVSTLYAFDRGQDIALQKARSNINQRNHMRLWLAPVTVQGLPVWMGQISRDIGVHLTSKTITTHKIDPDVDETRWYLLQDLFFSQGLDRFGAVGGVGAAPPENPRHNYTGDPYYTDGHRMVLWMSEQPVTYHRIRPIQWEAGR